MITSPLTLSLAGSVSNSRLAECVARLTEKLEAGEEFDLREICRDCPQNLEQLELLLPTLKAMVRVDRSLSHKGALDLPPSKEQADVVTGILGDFRILRELGRGGMGVVYEAEQISLGRRVALKVLPFAAMLDKQQLARFKNEARAAATLDHPNIVAIYSVGAERGVHYYAMQLIEGQSLAQIISAMKSGRPSSFENPAPEAVLDPNPTADDTAQAALPTVRASGSAAFSTIPVFDSRNYYFAIARLGIQAAEALDHAHQSGILHRDIKPGNLMLDDAGKLWITDFGLARIEADAGMTMTGDLLGTLRYMSPEQALAKRVVVDHRSDIYSLGVTLYELLTLQRAYAADDRQELLRQIAFEEPRKPRQINPRIPIDLETIILKSIEKNPADRYASASALADDLKCLISNQPIKALPATFVQRATKWSRRHVAVVWSVVAVSLCIAALFAVTTVLVAGAWKQTQRSEVALRNEVLEERRNLYRANVQIAQQEWEEGRVAAVDRLLDEFLPNDAYPDLRGWEWYYLKSLCHTEEASDPGELIARRSGSSSPLVIDRNGDSLFVRDFKSPEIRLSGISKKALFFSVSPDRRLLACIAGSWFSERSEIEIWDLESHVRQSHIKFDKGIAAVAWAPSGHRIAISQNPEETNVWDAASGKKIVRLTGLEGVTAASLAWSPDGAHIAAGTGPYVAVFDAKTGKLVRRNEAHDGGIFALAFSSDGRRIASGSWDQTITILTAETGAIERQLDTHNGKVNSISWSPNGKLLASAGGDGIVKIWDTSTWEHTNTLIGHRDGVDELVWVDDESLISGGPDGCKLWNAKEEQRFTSILAEPAHAWAATSRQLITWKRSPDGMMLEQYDLQNRAVETIGLIDIGKLNNTPKTVNVAGMEVSPRGRLLAVAGGASGVEIWDLSAKKRTLKIHAGTELDGLSRVAWSPDETMLATEVSNSSFVVLNSVTGDRIATLDAGRESLAGTAKWNPDGSNLATITYWGDVSIWDVKQWKVIHRLTQDLGRKWSPERGGITWSPTGDRLAGKVQGRVFIWDAKTGQTLVEFRAHVENIRNIAWSPDGSRLATSSEDRTIKIWNPDTGEDMLTLRGNNQPGMGVRTLSWSPDGKILASWGNNSLNLRDATPAYDAYR